MIVVGVVLVLAGVGVLAARHRIIGAMWARLDRATKKSGGSRDSLMGMVPSTTLVVVVGLAWIVLGASLAALTLTLQT
jgi:hypothetical protein